MNILKAVKTVSGIIGGAGVSAAITTVIKGNIPRNLEKHEKILIGIGTFILSEIGASMAIDYVEDQFKEVEEAKTAVDILIQNATKKEYTEAIDG